MSIQRTYTFKDGKQLHLGGKTLIMGILNITPDSFSDGGQWDTVDAAAAHMHEMVADGADLIDVGAESTRPGSTPMTADEEQERLMPFLQRLLSECPVPISVDTYHPETARVAAGMGVHILNDICGLQYTGTPDGAMARVAAETGLPIIVMHNPPKEGDVSGRGLDAAGGDILEDMKDFFRKSIAIADVAGVKREQIILDPGIGFGKDTPANLLVQKRLRELLEIDGTEYPLLFAASRKRFIGDVLGLPKDQRDEATGAAGVIAILNGACMLRVHDVRTQARMAALTDAILETRD